MVLSTPRLLLRSWRDEDLEPFARMNADPRVMEFFPAPLSRTESDALAEKIRLGHHLCGYGLYAAELRESGEFVGFIGLSAPSFKAHFTPCIEIGWRLAAEHWGKGLATEGAAAVREYAFQELGIFDLVSFTSEANLASRRVMEKIGMTRRPGDDFEHPLLPPGHPLRRHVLYRLSAPAFGL